MKLKPLYRVAKPSPPRKWYHSIRRRWRKIWSDYRLKNNIIRIGKLENGINIYEFNYKWSNKKYQGVIAQELLNTYPSAVDKRFGYYCVDYDKLGIEFQEVKD